MNAPVTIDVMRRRLLHAGPNVGVSYMLAQSISDPEHDIIIGGNRANAADYFGSTLFDQEVIMLSFSRSGSAPRPLSLSEVAACTDAVLGRRGLECLHSIRLTSSRVQYYATLIRDAQPELPTPLQAAFMARQLDAKRALSPAALEVLPAVAS